MDIQYHNFEDAKEEIKRFSEQPTTNLDFKKVDDSKDVGEFFSDLFLGRGIGLDHKVTGEELNELTSQIQERLHNINNTQIRLIKEFGQVYNALEALDRDYIQAILVSVKATEETSESIQKAQEKIEKIVENQRKTLEILKKFKQKLDGYVHLGDIDRMWESLSVTRDSVCSLSSEVKTVQKNVSKDQEDIRNLLFFMKKLSSLSHLMEVDEMWKQMENYQFRTQGAGRNDTYPTNKLNEPVQTANPAIESLAKKVKCAFWIAAGSAGFAIIELILLIVKVI